jgi:hypothetical protein
MLINCDECNKSVSSKAVSCPHCGNVINNQDNSSNLFSGCTGAIGNVFLFILVWGIIIYFFGDKLLALIIFIIAFFK